MSWKKAVMGSYSQWFIEEATLRLLEKVMWTEWSHSQGPQLMFWKLTSASEEPLRSMRSKTQAETKARTRTRKRQPHNTWLWKTARFLSSRKRPVFYRHRHPLKMHIILFTAIHPGLWYREGSIDKSNVGIVKSLWFWRKNWKKSCQVPCTVLLP